jgi:hypothetical protein
MAAAAASMDVLELRLQFPHVNSLRLGKFHTKEADLQAFVRPNSSFQSRWIQF